MTERAKKILSGKRKRALDAIGDSKRVMPDGLIFITKQEAETIGKWIEELEERIDIMSEGQPDIVRCKDCNNRGTSDCPLEETAILIPSDDWYCGDGERRGKDDG